MSAFYNGFLFFIKFLEDRRHKRSLVDTIETDLIFLLLKQIPNKNLSFLQSRINSFHTFSFFEKPKVIARKGDDVMSDALIKYSTI